MISITNPIFPLAKRLGVTFDFNSPVHEIVVKGILVKGVQVYNSFHAADIVVSTMDIYLTYKTLLPKLKATKKQL